MSFQFTQDMIYKQIDEPCRYINQKENKKKCDFSDMERDLYTDDNRDHIRYPKIELLVEPFPLASISRSSLYLRFMRPFPGVGLSTHIENRQIRNWRKASSSGSY